MFVYLQGCESTGDLLHLTCLHLVMMIDTGKNALNSVLKCQCLLTKYGVVMYVIFES